jgi:hypothetical protein
MSTAFQMGLAKCEEKMVAVSITLSTNKHCALPLADQTSFSIQSIYPASRLRKGLAWCMPDNSTAFERSATSCTVQDLDFDSTRKAPRAVCTSLWASSYQHINYLQQIAAWN